VAKLEAEVLKQQVAASQAEANNAESEGGSLLGMMGEALLDWAGRGRMGLELVTTNRFILMKTRYPGIRAGYSWQIVAYD